MNDSSRKISPLRQRMIEEMRMRQLAPKTRDAYIRAVLHFTAVTQVFYDPKMMVSQMVQKRCRCQFPDCPRPPLRPPPVSPTWFSGVWCAKILLPIFMSTGAHMKTTLEISDTLLKAAKAMARREGTTLRAVVERSIRAELKGHRAKRAFKLRDATVHGQGLQPTAARSTWDQLRDMSYGIPDT